MRKSMVRMAVIAILAPGTFAPLAAAQTYEDYAIVGDWRIVRQGSVCHATSREGLSLAYDWRLSQVTVSFSDASIRSLSEGEQRSLNQAFVFGGRLRQNPAPFTANVGRGPTRLVSQQRGDVLYLFSGASSVSYTWRARVQVRSFALPQSTRMVNELTACAMDQSRRNPSDPFASAW